LTTSSQSQRQRSGAVLIAKPPSQLALNRPNLNLFGPRMGFGTRFIASFLRDRGAVIAVMNYTTCRPFMQKDVAGHPR
jgi:hypothetical protein